MDKKINVGCNVLIFQDNKLLLGKRKNHSGAGTWGLPGGHLEYGEDLIDAAKRELAEEVGIKDANLTFISVTENEKKNDHYIQINFLLQDPVGEIKLMEPEFCEEWKFFALDDLPEIFPPHKNIIQAYIEKQTYLH